MRTFLIALFVAATIGVCHAYFGLDSEGQKLYNRLFEMGQEPMTTEETIDGLRELKRLDTNLFLTKRIDEFLKAADFIGDRCSSDYLDELSDVFRWNKYGGPEKGSNIINAAAMVKAQIEPQKKFCIEEFERRLNEGKKTADPTNKAYMDELLDTLDPKSFGNTLDTYASRWSTGYLWKKLPEFVAKKAGDSELYSTRWLAGGVPSTRKYKAAYKKFVLDPCEKFESTFGPAAKIGLAIEYQLPHELQVEGLPLFKQRKICKYARLDTDYLGNFERYISRQQLGDY